jgi:hypothetical protein
MLQIDGGRSNVEKRRSSTALLEANYRRFRGDVTESKNSSAVEDCLGQ